MPPHRDVRQRADAARLVTLVAFPDAQVLDVTGPLEVFARTSRWLQEHGRDEPGYHIALLGTVEPAIVTSFGIVNAIVRPLVVLLTLPLTLVTLGLFLLVVNGLMLALVAALLPDTHVAGFGSAILGSILVSITGWIASWAIGPRGRVEILIVRR